MNPKVGKAITDAVVNLLDAVKEVVKDQGYQYFQVDGSKSEAGVGATNSSVGAKPGDTVSPGPQISKPEVKLASGSDKGNKP